MYVLHVCMSIKIHCLLNTGLLPTCRNMHKHTLHTHRHTQTQTHAHAHTHAHMRTCTSTHAHTCTHRHNPASQAVGPNLQVRFTERRGAQHLGPHLTGGLLGPAAGTRLPSPRGQHMDPPHTGSGSSHAFVLFPAAL